MNIIVAVFIIVNILAVLSNAISTKRLKKDIDIAFDGLDKTLDHFEETLFELEYKLEAYDYALDKLASKLDAEDENEPQPISS